MDYKELVVKIAAYEDDEIKKVLNTMAIYHKLPVGYRPDHDYSQDAPHIDNLDFANKILPIFENEANRRELPTAKVLDMEVGSDIVCIEGIYKIQKKYAIPMSFSFAYQIVELDNGDTFYQDTTIYI